MFRVILESQWRWCRLVIVLGTVSAFALPVLSLQGATRGEGTMAPDALLQWLQSWGILYPLLAAVLGLLVAMAAWAPDHRGRHVHALSLPLPRWRYVLLRFGAGLTVLALPIIALLTGAVLATATAVIPVGLHGYAWALGLRFALAVLVAFSVFFAISGSTARTAGIILSIAAGLIVVQIVASAANIDLDILGRAQWAFLNWPGPLAIFTGRWMLIDV